MTGETHPTTPELDALKDAATLASPLHPGRHLAGIFVMTVWENDAPPHDAVCDFLATPPEQTVQMMSVVAKVYRDATDAKGE